MRPNEFDPADLLAHDHRLRALARALVLDGASADDLAQETWLAALRRGADMRSASAWLGTVARRMAGRMQRGEARRARREEHGARPEGEPSTLEILAREEARARVVASLSTLDEPQRTTLVLRFIEGLTPKAVARRMGVPVETVRTRTRRALEELRARLDGEYGERGRWLAALVPLLRPPARPFSAIPATLVTVGSLVLATWWFAAATSKGNARASDSREEAVARLSQEIPTHKAPTSALGARVDLGTTPPTPPEALTSTFGELLVHVDWSDGTPAEGVVVRVLAGAENPELHVREGTTDAAGNARFAALAAGTARIGIDRVPGPERETTLVAGELTTYAHRLAAGFDVRGLVTDEDGEPIGGAQILLGHGAALLNGPFVARSASDGTFFLRELTQAFLGARAPGFQPSPLEARFAAPDATLDVHLRLARGAGEVRGRVVRFGSDEPVPEAWVRIGESAPRGEWRDNEEVWGALVCSDAAGEFLAVGLRPGRHTVLARAEGFGGERGEVEVSSDSVAELTLALPPEAVLEGTVSDTLGNPLAGQRVRVGPEDGPFTASTTSGADGSFRVGSLAIAQHVAWVEERGSGAARHEFVALPGRTETWNALLTAGLEVTGRVLDERGEPRAGWMVRIEDETFVAVDADNAFTPTAADGSFRFRNVRERPHMVTVSAPRSLFVLAARHGVWPGQDELQFRVRDDELPSARVVGTFLDEAGRVVPEMMVIVVAENAAVAPQGSPDPRTGAFDSGLVPAGRTQVYVRTPDRAPFLLGPRVLAPGETWDLGLVQLEPEGSLFVRLVGDAPPGPELELLLTTSFEAAFQGEGFERRSTPLRPGTHRLYLRGGEYEEAFVDCEVQPGQETVVELALRRGWRTPVAVRGAGDAGRLFVVVRRPDGTLLEHEVQPASGPETRVEFRLAPGEYPCEARSGRRTATGVLQVTATDRLDPALTLELR